MPKAKDPLYVQWIKHQYNILPDSLFGDDAIAKLLTNERECQAVFLALNHIMSVAQDNEDDECANACCEVIDGLSRARLAYIELS